MLFAAGETFAGNYVLHGSGTFATSTYTSSYATAFASEDAACKAGSAPYGATRATLVADATTAGLVSPTPAQWGDKWCGRKAIRPAQDTAWATAAAASQWITVGRYGSGANPVLDGGSTRKAGLSFAQNAVGGTTSKGGWRFRDLNLANFTRAGIYFSNHVGYTAPGPTGGSYTSDANGMWVHDIAMSGITMGGMAACPSAGCPITPSSAAMFPDFEDNFVATGISVWGSNYVRVEDATLNTTDAPWHLQWGRHHIVDQVSANLSYWEHPANALANFIRVSDTTLNGMCTRGYSQGSAGILIAAASDVLLENVTITGVPVVVSPIDGVLTPDEVGIDWESAVTDFLADQCTIGGAGANGVGGAALLAFNTAGVPNPPGPVHGTNLFTRNTIARTGLMGTVTLARVSTAPTAGQQGQTIWWANDVTRASPPVGVNPEYTANDWRQITGTTSYAIPSGWAEFANTYH